MSFSYISSYNQAFLSRPALRMQRRVAFGVALLFLAAMIGVFPVSSFYLGSIPCFLPMFFTVMVLCNGFSSLLIGLQAIHLKHATLAILAGGFAFIGVSCFFQLLLLPDIFGNRHLTIINLAHENFEQKEQILSWFIFLTKIIFLIFIITSISQKDKTRNSKTIFSFWLMPIFLSPLLLFFLTKFSQLPPLFLNINHKIEWSELLTKGFLPVQILLIFLTCLLLSRKSRFRTRLHLWLGVSLIALFCENILKITCFEVFTVGWYGSIFFSILSTLTLLGSLLWDSHEMQSTLQRINAQLHQQANHDALTGLLLRRPFNDFLLNTLKDKKRNHNSPAALMMIDVDDFKAYNDSFGHLSGDSCLISICQALETIVKSNNGYLARMGGEEMAALFPNPEKNTPAQLGEMLRNEVEKLRLPHSPKASKTWVTVSIGWANSKSKYTSSEWLKKADEALYEAKNSGRNKVVEWDHHNSTKILKNESI